MILIKRRSRVSGYIFFLDVLLLLLLFIVVDCLLCAVIFSFLMIFSVLLIVYNRDAKFSSFQLIVPVNHLLS